MNNTTERTKKSITEKMEAMNMENSNNKDMKDRALVFCLNGSEIGGKFYVYLPVECLRVDRKIYQRPLQAHVDKIAREWNPDRCDAITVNYRNDGYFYVIDGQHRLEAAKMKGVKNLVCSVMAGMTIKEEAELFTKHNVGTKQPGPYDTYKANLVWGEETDTKISNVCNKYGVSVTKGVTVKNLMSVTAARDIVKKNGEAALDWIYGIIEEAGWNTENRAYNKNVLCVLDTFKRNHAENLSEARKILLEFMKTFTPEEWNWMGNVEYPQCNSAASRMAMILDEVMAEGGAGKLHQKIYENTAA